MITIVTFVVIMMVAWTIRELVVAALVRRRRREIQHVLRQEVTRRYFAEARTELMDLLFEGEIDPNSVTFTRFYHLNTAFMRSPDEYSKLAHALCVALFTSTNRAAGLSEESKTWSPSVKKMVFTTAKALDNLIFEYSA